MVFHSPYTRLLFIFGLSCHFLNAAPPTGDNLWHLTAAIGTAVDEVSVCCMETFTTIESIASSITQLATAQATCCINTFTVLADIRANLPGGSCVPTILTLTASGTTISASGVYCLNNDVVITVNTPAITINASNVVLDLSGHTITGSAATAGYAAIQIKPGASETSLSNITIKNGHLISTSNASRGINIDTSSMPAGDFLSDIIIQDLSIINNTQGSIVVSAISQPIYNLLIKNIVMDNQGFATSYHMSIIGIINGLIDSCFMTGNISQANLFIQGNTELIVSNCTATLPSTLTGTVNNFQANNALNVIFENCKSFGAFGDGFQINASGASTSPFTITLNNCISQNFNSSTTCNGFHANFSNIATNLNIVFNNCQASSDGVKGVNGFLLEGSSVTYNAIFRNCRAENFPSNGYLFSFGGITTANFNCDLDSCIANNNGVNGFSFASGAFKSLLNNCTANNNANGFVFNPAITGVCNIQYCTASNNSNNGFSGTSSADNKTIFYLNQASNNLTNYINIGSASANLALFTDTIIGRGDNLRSTSP